MCALTYYLYASGLFWSIPVWAVSAAHLAIRSLHRPEWPLLDGPAIIILVWALCATVYYGVSLIFRSPRTDNVLLHYIILTILIVWGGGILSLRSINLEETLRTIQFLETHFPADERNHARIAVPRLIFAAAILGWWFVLVLLINLGLLTARVGKSNHVAKWRKTLSEISEPSALELHIAKYSESSLGHGI